MGDDMSNQTFPIWRFRNDGQMATLYYYNGNFFYPIFLANKGLEGRICRLCRLFEKKNKNMVKADREHPEYLNKVELAELQGL